MFTVGFGRAIFFFEICSLLRPFLLQIAHPHGLAASTEVDQLDGTEPHLVGVVPADFVSSL